MKLGARVASSYLDKLALDRGIHHCSGACFMWRTHQQFNNTMPPASRIQSPTCHCRRTCQNKTSRDCETANACLPTPSQSLTQNRNTRVAGLQNGGKKRRPRPPVQDVCMYVGVSGVWRFSIRVCRLMLRGVERLEVTKAHLLPRLSAPTP